MFSKFLIDQDLLTAVSYSGPNKLKDKKMNKLVKKNKHIA